MCGSDSVVEFHLAKVEVAGPNPVSRSKVVKATRFVGNPFAYGIIAKR